MSAAGFQFSIFLARVIADGIRGPKAVRFDLVLGKAPRWLAETMAEGAAAGKDDQPGGPEWERFTAAELVAKAEAHLVKWAAGDTSEDHLAHAFCRLMMAKAKEEEEAATGPGAVLRAAMEGGIQ